MTPEAAFVAGAATALLTAWLGYHVIEIVQRRLTEEEQWRTVLFESDPSASYWAQVTIPSSTDPATYGPEESELIRVYSPRRIE